MLVDLGDGLLSTLTSIRSANPVGPVSARASGVVFIADPIDLTLPEPGGESRRGLGVGFGLIVVGAALVMLAGARKRSGRALVT